MRYASAKLVERAEQKAYRIFVTDALQIISENTGKQVPEGKVMSKRFADIVYSREERRDSITGAQAIAQMKDALGKVGEENGI